jgi:hypothetical protein
MKLRDMLSVVAVATLALWWLGGCSSSKEPGSPVKNSVAAEPANLVCPMSGKVVAVGKDAPPTSTFEGKAVGFCCAKCPAAWDKLSDADKKAKLAAAMDKQNSMVANAKCPMTSQPINKAIDMRIYDGKIVGFCCAGCPEEWDKLSDADKKAKLDAAMK